jgi:hypothetical protein
VKVVEASLEVYREKKRRLRIWVGEANLGGISREKEIWAGEGRTDVKDKV